MTFENILNELFRSLISLIQIKKDNTTNKNRSIIF